VAVTATNPDDSVQIHIVPQLDPAGSDFWIHVKPVLRFVQRPDAVQGLGLENAVVVVGAFGSSLRAPLIVTMTTTNGTFGDEQQVTLGAGRTAIAHLRSRGLGPVTIGAFAPGFDAATASVKFSLPWMFLIVALAGGAAGGAVRQISGSNATAMGVIRAAVRGAAIGAVVAVVYYAVRVNLISVPIDIQYLNEMAVFALAVIGGLVGIRTPAAAGP
jgi:hypothetical protein